jgi:hypothetical protein
MEREQIWPINGPMTEVGEDEERFRGVLRIDVRVQIR